jgi:hypothetical protein
MKFSFMALFLFTSLSAFAAREQCSVDKKDNKKTAITTITLPESKQGKMSFNGYNLDCDSAAQGWCTFKVGVNAQETIYTISDRTYLKLEKKTGKARKGTFVSDFYATGKVSVTCKVPVMVRHN